MTDYTEYTVLEYANGYREWYLNGKQVTEEEHARRTSPTEEMTLAQVCEALGKNIKIIDKGPGQKWKGDVADLPDSIRFARPY